MDPVGWVIKVVEGVAMKERREVSPEMMEARQAASEVEVLEARSEKEKARLTAKSRQHKREINKYWVHVWQGGAPQ